MSIETRLKQSYQRMKVQLKHPSLLAAKGLEGIVGFTTPIAAVMTMGAEPDNSLVQKVITGPYEVARGSYELLSTYIQNTGVRDAVNGTVGEVFKLIGNAAENIAEKSGQTLLAIGLAYILGKATQYAIKEVRKSKEEKYLGI